MVTDRYAISFLPAIIHAEYDSAFDALVALGVAREEAMDLTVAEWQNPRQMPSPTLLTSVDGGRPVVAVLLENGRWGAGNAYPEHAAHSRQEAERRLSKLLKRGRRGVVAEIREPCQNFDPNLKN